MLGSLRDGIGKTLLDIVLDVADWIRAERKDPALIAPTTLRRLVEAGRGGRKTGRGFYDS